MALQIHTVKMAAGDTTEYEGTSHFRMRHQSAKIGALEVNLYPLWKEKSHEQHYTSWR